MEAKRLFDRSMRALGRARSTPCRAGRAAALWARTSIGALFLVIAQPVAANLAVDLAPDTTVQLGGAIFFDHEVAIDAGGSHPSTTPDLGPLPVAAELDAYHLGTDGEEYFSLDTVAELPGALRVSPGDLVRWDGLVYTLAFDASDHGLGAAVDLDAATRLGSDWLLSFDTTVQLGGLTVQDEDVVAFDGVGFVAHLDGGAVGIPPALDLDGLHAFPGSSALALSLDGSGVLAGRRFDDEDVLFLPGTGSAAADAWLVLHDGSAVDPAWARADVGAVHFVPEPGAWLGLGWGTAGILVMAHRRRGRDARARTNPSTGRAPGLVLSCRG